jgi:hypothetical protein
VFPIWDSRIEELRTNRTPSHDHMSDTANYLSYADEVHELRRAPAFPNFMAKFTAASNSRLTRMGIAPYAISEVRAVESALIELGAAQSG